MEPTHESHEPTSAQLLTIIRVQTEIAKLGLDLNGVMTLVTEQARAITKASGAVVELAEGDEMVYRAVAGTASSRASGGRCRDSRDGAPHPGRRPELGYGGTAGG